MCLHKEPSSHKQTTSYINILEFNPKRFFYWTNARLWRSGQGSWCKRGILSPEPDDFRLEEMRSDQAKGLNVWVI